jgi:hypothetical protein
VLEDPTIIELPGKLEVDVSSRLSLLTAEGDVEREIPEIKLRERGKVNLFKRGHAARTDFCIPPEVHEYYFEVDIEEDGGMR